MLQDELKRKVAREAIKFVPVDSYVGVGTGSTVDFFIDELAPIRHQLRGTVASSEKTAARLKSHGIQVVDLNSVNELPVYIDGADEVTRHGAMIKGGGGALTREKIIAAVARKFICIVDQSKVVNVLGKFPLPLEVVPMGRSYVARKMVGMGGRPVLREHFTTDNGNQILDVFGFNILDPVELEAAINQVVGVVTVGLFARRGANVLLTASSSGVQTLML